MSLTFVALTFRKQNISSAPVGDFKNVSSQPEPKASKPGYTKHQQQQQQPAEPKAVGLYSIL